MIQNFLEKEFTIFANLLADEAEKIIKKYFRTPLNVDSKEDRSPVTLADKEVELKIKQVNVIQSGDAKKHRAFQINILMA